MGPTGPAQSTLLFNQAGQAFSIPLHAAHLQQLSQAATATAMYSSDGAQYFQPVTQLTAQQKSTRTDRLEVCVFFFIRNHFFSHPLFSTVLREFLVSEVYKCLPSSQTRQTHIYIYVYIYM
jgi:hypothetical protein